MVQAKAVRAWDLMVFAGGEAGGLGTGGDRTEESFGHVQCLMTMQAGFCGEGVEWGAWTRRRAGRWMVEPALGKQ